MKASKCMFATRHVVISALLLSWPLHAGAQPSPLILSPSPDVLGAAGPLCYYAGLSYTVGAVVTVKVPVRREIVSDTPWLELRCEANPTSSGSANWVEVDPDEGDPFRD
jgi:H+/gluconate symporter-like permease